jgi:hypothetical protein
LPLFEYFLKQVDKYGGASDATLQQSQYLREAVFLRTSTPKQAAREALKRRSARESGSAEDLAALQNFRRTCALGLSTRFGVALQAEQGSP